jgi:hypothetical protein
MICSAQPRHMALLIVGLAGAVNREPLGLGEPRPGLAGIQEMGQGHGGLLCVSVGKIGPCGREVECQGESVYGRYTDGRPAGTVSGRFPLAALPRKWQPRPANPSLPSTPASGSEQKTRELPKLKPALGRFLHPARKTSIQLPQLARRKNPLLLSPFPCCASTLTVMDRNILSPGCISQIEHLNALNLLILGS